MRLGALIMKGGNLVVVVVVVVTTVVWVAGANENWPSVLSAPKWAMFEDGMSLFRLLSSGAGVGNLEANGEMLPSVGIDW
jgi:hypothetical protein